MRILLTNDDGLHAEGLQALLAEVRQLGEVTVVAPDRERSAVGHSLTFHNPLRVRRVSQEPGCTVFVTDGTPTDCVLLALYDLMPHRPDVLFAGINRGGNLGDDITYSGTVSAAMEGMIHGIPSAALSQVGRGRYRYAAGARFATRLARAILENGMPPRTFLNVNFPDLEEHEIQGVAITRQGDSIYDQRIVKRTDPWGADYYWITGAVPTGQPHEGTDFRAILEGKISITPVQINMTNFELIEELSRWRI